MTDPIDRFRDWDAAYVLGALSADDRRAFERHLATCPECSAGVAELAGLPGILGKLSPTEAAALLDETPSGLASDEHLRDEAHTPGLVQRLAASAKRRRRRVRFGMLSAAVAIVALLSVGGITFAANQLPASSTVAMAPLGQNDITASMQVTEKGWGTRFDWSCDYHDASWEGRAVSYDLVVTDDSGTQTTVATWSSAGPHASGLSASSRIATADIRNVEIRLSGSATPLLRENL